MTEITIRRAKTTDDFYEIASCLYMTDPYIYPGAFGSDIYQASSAIVALMQVEGSLFSFSNFSLAYSGDKLCGILLCNRGGLCWDLTQSMDAAKDYLPNVDNFIYVADNYFSQETLAPAVKHIEIVACCVMPECRNMGIGSRLLSWLVEEYPDMTFTLDVLASNPAAISLYEKFGFCVTKAFKGFSMDEASRPDCYNMVRKPFG